MAKKKRKLKEVTRDLTYAFRTTKEVLKSLEKIGKECSRTRSLQCEFFIKDGIERYKRNKEEGTTLQQFDTGAVG